MSRQRPASGLLAVLVTLLLTTHAQGLCYHILGVTTCTEWNPSMATAKGSGLGRVGPPLDKPSPNQQPSHDAANSAPTYEPTYDPEADEGQYADAQQAPSAAEHALGGWGAVGGVGNYEHVVNPYTPEYVEPSPIVLPGGAYADPSEEEPSPEPTYKPAEMPDSTDGYQQPSAGCYEMLHGATIGQAAGLAACGRVTTSCSTFQPFASPATTGPDQTDTPCNNLAMASCKSSAAQAAASNMMCFEFFQTDSDKCTTEEALDIFNAAVDRMCEPLCPDCDSDGGAAAAREELVEDGIDDLMIPEDGEPNLNCLCPPQNEPVCLFEDGSFAARNIPCAICAGYTTDKIVPCSSVIHEDGSHAYDETAENTYEEVQEDKYETEESAPEGYPVSTSMTAATGAQAGCSSTGVPFGLDDCVCDGLAVGEVVGLAACSRVVTECSDFMAFTADEVQQTGQMCDAASKAMCEDTAMAVASQNAQCVQMLQHGSDTCSGQATREIFRATVIRLCEPLCPDC